MRKSTFQGFQPGPVRVRVTQGESVKDAAFTLTAPPDGKGEGPTSPDDFAGTLDLSANRLEGIAPCGIAFEVEADGFGVGDHYHDLRYRWSFGDPGHYTRHDVDDMPWDRVYDVDGAIRIVRGIDIYDADGTTLLETQDRAPAVPSGQRVTFLGNDRNIAYGPRVVHVFEKPGSYTVTCEALSHQMVAEGQDPVLKTLTVEVKDMLDAVPRHRVACILGEAPAGAEPEGALVFRTYLDAMNAVRNSTAPVALLFRRGQTFTIDNSTVVWGNSKPMIAIAGAYGPEKDGDPVLSNAPKIMVGQAAGTQLIYTGIRFKGPYDSTNPYSISSWPPKCIRVDNKWGGFVTVWDCDLSGFDMCIEGSPEVANFVIGNCFIHSWMNYGIFLAWGLKSSGLCGVWAKQPIGTVTGGGKSDNSQPFIADHGPFRCSQSAGAFSFNLCDLRSLNSWFGDYQPNIRLGGWGTGEFPESSENVVERVRGEVGDCISSGVFAGNAFPKRAVYDKVYQVLYNGSGAHSAMNFSSPGQTIRNTISVIMNQPKIGGALTDWVRHTNDPYDPSVTDYGISIYNSTFVDLRNDANGTPTMVIDYEGFELFKSFTFENNILSRPNRSVPEDELGPLDHTVLWNATYDGLRYESDPFKALYAAAPDTAALYAPTGNSAAIGTATKGRVAVDDFFGRIRDPKKAAPSKGAVEPI